MAGDGTNFTTEDRLYGGEQLPDGMFVNANTLQSHEKKSLKKTHDTRDSGIPPTPNTLNNTPSPASPTVSDITHFSDTPPTNDIITPQSKKATETTSINDYLCAIANAENAENVKFARARCFYAYNMILAKLEAKTNTAHIAEKIRHQYQLNTSSGLHEFAHFLSSIEQDLYQLLTKARSKHLSNILAHFFWARDTILPNFRKMLEYHPTKHEQSQTDIDKNVTQNCLTPDNSNAHMEKVRQNAIAGLNTLKDPETDNPTLDILSSAISHESEAFTTAKARYIEATDIAFTRTRHEILRATADRAAYKSQLDLYLNTEIDDSFIKNFRIALKEIEARQNAKTMPTPEEVALPEKLTHSQTARRAAIDKTYHTINNWLDQIEHCTKQIHHTRARKTEATETKRALKQRGQAINELVKKAKIKLHGYITNTSFQQALPQIHTQDAVYYDNICDPKTVEDHIAQSFKNIHKNDPLYQSIVNKNRLPRTNPQLINLTPSLEQSVLELAYKHKSSSWHFGRTTESLKFVQRKIRALQAQNKALDAELAYEEMTQASDSTQLKQFEQFVHTKQQYNRIQTLDEIRRYLGERIEKNKWTRSNRDRRRYMQIIMLCNHMLGEENLRRFIPSRAVSNGLLSLTAMTKEATDKVLPNLLNFLLTLRNPNIQLSIINQYQSTQTNYLGDKEQITRREQNRRQELANVERADTLPFLNHDANASNISTEYETVPLPKLADSPTYTDDEIFSKFGL